MPDDTVNIFLGEIARCKHWIEVIKAEWGEYSQRQIRVKYFDLGLQSQNIAIYSLLLGNKIEAIAWFKEATEYFSKRLALGGINVANMAVETLLSSILSGDKDLMIKSAICFNSLEGKTSGYFYDFAGCLSNLILGNDGNAIGFANKLTDMEPLENTNIIYYDGLGMVCEGIASLNTSIVKTGLDIVLKSHLRLIQELSSISPDALICQPATALIRLAKDHGMEIESSNFNENVRKYIPWNLFE